MYIISPAASPPFGNCYYIVLAQGLRPYFCHLLSQFILMEIRVSITGINPFLLAHKKLIFAFTALTAYILIAYVFTELLLPYAKIFAAFQLPDGLAATGLDVAWTVLLLGVCCRLMIWPPASQFELVAE